MCDPSPAPRARAQNRANIFSTAVLGVHPNGVGPAVQHGATLTPSSGDDRAVIQSALNAAGNVATRASRRVVRLAAGTFTVGGTLSIPSNVILRGTLSGSTRLTVLNQAFTGTLVVISGGSGSTCWCGPAFGG